MSQDMARIELVHALETVRRRVQVLEERLAELDRAEALQQASSNGAAAHAPQHNGGSPDA
jgi:hypothetical protein